MSFQHIHVTLGLVASTHVRKLILDLILNNALERDMGSFVVAAGGLDERLQRVAELPVGNPGSDVLKVAFSAHRSSGRLVRVGKIRWCL